MFFAVGGEGVAMLKNGGWARRLTVPHTTFFTVKIKLLKELTRMKVLKQSLTALNLTGNLTKFQ